MIFFPLHDWLARQGILEATLRQCPSAPNVRISFVAQNCTASSMQEVPTVCAFDGAGKRPVSTACLFSLLDKVFLKRHFTASLNFDSGLPKLISEMHLQ